MALALFVLDIHQTGPIYSDNIQFFLYTQQTTNNFIYRQDVCQFTLLSLVSL